MQQLEERHLLAAELIGGEQITNVAAAASDEILGSDGTPTSVDLTHSNQTTLGLWELLTDLDYVGSASPESIRRNTSGQIIFLDVDGARDVAYAGPVTVRAALELLGAAYALHPAFAEAEIVEAGAGVRPAFPDNVPRIVVRGRTLHVNGLYRHGFLMAPALAVRVAEYLETGAMDERVHVLDRAG